jgi:branched-chain amino acid transport system ATP-binding protein
VLFAAVIIGGAGNHVGAVLGAILVPVGFEEVTRFIPTSNNLPPNLIPSLEWVAIGLLIVIFLWVRPQGILPERKRVIRAGPVVAGDGAPAGGGTPHHPSPAEAAPSVAASPDADGQSRAPHPPAAAAAAPSAAASADADGQPSVLSAPHSGEVAGDGGPPSAHSSPGSPAAARLDRPGGVVLEVVGVSREFGGVRAVDDVSFSVRAGTLTGLIGPNGAGKSTLLAMLAGTLPVSSGTVLYRGQDVTGLAAFRRARLGLVRTFQLASEFKRLTVMENLLSAVPGNRGDSFRGAVRGKRYWRADEAAAIARAEGMLERFGLEGFANDYAGDLSGGQRRLVEIMRALMAEPSMLLLDEPMAGVHPNLARRIGDQLVALCAEGMTILMVEHELAIMDEFCDPVVVMAEGSVLAEGTMAQLRARSEVVEAYLVG